MKRGRLDLTGTYRLVAALRRLRPEILQTWLYHADLAGLVTGTLTRVPVIVWNIRCTDLDAQDYPITTRVVRRALTVLSSWPTAIVSNSQAGIIAHQQAGYRAQRWVLIPNGFDTDTFQPSLQARLELRQELGLASDVRVVGLLARAHPMKDHTNFLKAAALVAERHADVEFVVAGRGVPDNSTFKQLARDLGLARRTHLLGERLDVPRFLAALDIAVSSSYGGEAFPNAVAEAMACGTATVVTDVGDSAAIVGDTRRVVPPRNPAALAEAVRRVLEMSADDLRELGHISRARVISEYSIQRAAARYEDLYATLAGTKARDELVVCAE
jgi:glycosyltransferase involved in cell wall biosynthesis